jgi:hypothetical protein
VVSATFTDAGGTDVATIEVTPASFGPIAAGETESFNVSKTAGSLEPANGCETLECNATYTLTLVLDVGGTEVTAEASAAMDCVF